MKKLLPFLSSIYIVAASAQTKDPGISGIIMNIDDTPVESATVFLIKQKDSSIVGNTLTDKWGKFEIMKIPAGSYFISVTAIGYQVFKSSPFSLGSENRAVNIPTIHLLPAVKNMRGVTVAAQRPFVERKIDRLLVNVSSSPLNAGASALEVLEKSPGVTIDENDNISLSGKQGVVIYIDGKPSYLSGRDLSNFLRGLLASQLDQLEIMTQPPAQYEAAGDAGIINIKTKKNHANGFNSSITTSLILSYHTRSRNSVVLNWKKKNINLSANLSYASLKNFVDQHIERKYRKNTETSFNRYLDQTARLNISQYPQNGIINLDFKAGKNTTLGMVASGNFGNTYQWAKGLITISDSINKVVQVTDYVTASKNPVSNKAINFNLQQKLPAGRELAVNADYIYYDNPASQSSYNFGRDGNNNPLEPVILENSSPLNIRIYSLKSDYNQPLPGNARLEAGFKIGDVNTDDDVHYHSFNQQQDQWLVDTGRTYHFLYEENINAVYASVNKQFDKKWTMQAGTRLEETHAKGHELVQKASFKRNYIDVFPTVYVNYAQNEKNNFRIGYDRRIYRPNYQFLNPFQSVIDQFTFSQGNPMLRPTLTDNIELTYDHSNQLTLTLNYTLTHRLFSPLFQTINQGNNYVTLQIPINLSSRRNMGVAVNYRKTFAKWWNFSTDVRLFNNRISNIIDSSARTAALTICFATINNQFPLKKGWTFDLSGFIRSKRLEGFPVYAMPNESFSIGMSKKIKSVATITLNLNDPFYLLKGGTMSDRNTFVFRSHNRPENRFVTFTLNYRFGKTIQQSRKNSGGAQDELDRL